jgi:hypothetical protein
MVAENRNSVLQVSKRVGIREEGLLMNCFKVCVAGFTIYSYMRVCFPGSACMRFPSPVKELS